MILRNRAAVAMVSNVLLIPWILVVWAPAVVVGLYARNLKFGLLEVYRCRTDQHNFENYVSYHAQHMLRRLGWSHKWALNQKHFDLDFVSWVDTLIAT